MKNKDYDKWMRGFQVDDAIVPQETYIALHIDGDNFSEFTKDLTKPFDLQFHNTMTRTAEYLMWHFNAIATIIQFDEISLILDKDFNMFNRNIGKIISKSSALTTVAFLLKGDYIHRVSRIDSPEYHGFATHVYSLPNLEYVEDYISWRRSDATKNSLNTICYWKLRNDGLSARKATSELSNKNQQWKHDFLFERGINFNDLPEWQRQGTLLLWEIYEKIGHNPINGEKVKTKRKRIVRNPELPPMVGIIKFLTEWD